MATERRDEKSGASSALSVRRNVAWSQSIGLTFREVAQMKLEDVERMARQLDPQDQRRLVDGIWRHLNAPSPDSVSVEARRARRMAIIARCDDFAGPDGELDSAEDLRTIRYTRPSGPV